MRSKPWHRKLGTKRSRSCRVWEQRLLLPTRFYANFRRTAIVCPRPQGLKPGLVTKILLGPEEPAPPTDPCIREFCSQPVKPCPTQLSFQEGQVNYRSMPAIEADIRLAMVPASMARMPRRASSPRLLGASAPMPPN